MPDKDSGKTKNAVKGRVSNEWTDMRPLSLESEPENSNSTAPGGGKPSTGKSPPANKKK